MTSSRIIVPAFPWLLKLGSAWHDEYVSAVHRNGWHPAGPVSAWYADPGFLVPSVRMLESLFEGARYDEPFHYWLRLIGRGDLVGATSKEVVFRSLSSVNAAGRATPSERGSHRDYCRFASLDSRANGTITVGDFHARFIGLMGNIKGRTIVLQARSEAA